MKSKIAERVIVCIIVILSFLAPCQPQQKQSDLSGTLLPVTLCELARNAADYDGKIVRVNAVIASLEKGPYLFTTDCHPYYMPLVETADFSGLSSDIRRVFDISRISRSKAELETPMEVDIVIIGTFDSHYRREALLDEIFRYRIKATSIEQKSSLRKLRRLGAA